MTISLDEVYSLKGKKGNRMDDVSPRLRKKLKFVARYTRETPEDILKRWDHAEPRQVQEEVWS